MPAEGGVAPFRRGTRQCVAGDEPVCSGMTIATPDGGVRAWSVAVASFLCNGIIFGLLNTCSVIYKKLQSDLEKRNDEHASAKAALVGSLAMGTTFLFSAAAGVLVDRAGIRPTAFAGGALATAGMFLSSFFTNNVMALWVTYGLLLGLGASLAYTPSLVILGHYFDRRMGLVNGLVCSGSSVFTIFMPFLIQSMVDNLGLKYTFMSLASLMAVVMLSAIVFRPLHGRAKGEKAPALFNMEIWKDRRYVLWALTIPFTLLGYFVPYVHAVTFVDVHFAGNDGALLVLSIGISSGIGRLIFGKIADYPNINRIVLQQISFVMIGILTMCMTAAPNFSVLMAIALGMGFFDGCFITLLGPIAYDLCGRSGAGQAIGCLLALCAIPITIGPPIAGMIFDSTKSYTVPFILSGIPPILGGLVLTFIRCIPDKASGVLKEAMEAGEDPAEEESLVDKPNNTVIVKVFQDSEARIEENGKVKSVS